MNLRTGTGGLMSKKKKKQKEEVIENAVMDSNEENPQSEASLFSSSEANTADRSQDEVLSEERAEELQQVIDELGEDVNTEASLFLQEEAETEGFLPDATESELLDDEISVEADVEGSELANFESAEIEDVIFIEEERLESIIESILFASDRPVSLASIQMVFKGTNIKKDKIRRALDRLAVEYAGFRRGVTLEEVTGGYQLRTKVDNMDFLKGTVKARQFKLSGPALEVLAITAYKQPVVKSEIDAIRGVESGHLLRALMERGLVNFEGKSELPGRPMQYGTTRKFLEIFGLRNTKELPTLSQIDELLPEGIGEEQEQKKETLSMITDSLSEQIGVSYSEGEDELLKIQDQLQEINTSSEFFEQEKLRQKMKRDADKAQNLREAIALGEEVSTRDMNWLRKYDEALSQGQSAQFKDEEELKAEAEEKKLAAEINQMASDNEENEAEEELPFYGESDEVDEEKDASV